VARNKYKEASTRFCRSSDFSPYYILLALKWPGHTVRFSQLETKTRTSLYEPSYYDEPHHYASTKTLCHCP
jgi:hypothetical protein